jgi:hypothetical protein
MKLSEYIAVLQKMLEEHGDAWCEDSYGALIGSPEYSDEHADPVYVLADKA